MELEVGMYAYIQGESRDYGIGIIKKFEWGIKEQQVEIQFKHSYRSVSQSEVVGSFNPIDLIQVGDYVNGERVIALKNDISERNIHMNSKGNSIFVDYDLANDWYYGIDDKDIKSIVTKEAFKSMEYRLGDK